LCRESPQLQIQHAIRKASNRLQTLGVGDLAVFQGEETLRPDDMVSLEESQIQVNERGTKRTIQTWVVNTVGVVVKFLNVKTSLVGRIVLGKSTARFADLSALDADPAARRSCHGGGMGGGSGELEVHDTPGTCFPNWRASCSPYSPATPTIVTCHLSDCGS
jgi:hypothetical protein